MKSTAIVCAIAAVSLVFGSLSYAQGYQQRGERREARQEARSDVREARRDIREGRRDLRDARDDRRNDRHAGNYGARGPQFHRGGHIPQEYRSRQYVVSDWRGHHLSAPPRGHQWVQVGSDYVLIAVATGLIANLLLNQ
ncbi:MAG: RcnB family protein [Ramlibacter sp.]